MVQYPGHRDSGEPLPPLGLSEQGWVLEPGERPVWLGLPWERQWAIADSEWPAGEGAEEDKLQGRSSPAPWNSCWCYPLEDPSWSQRERELTGVVQRGQSPRSQGRVEKALERAKGRIQHNYYLPQGTQSNGRRLTHKQVSFSTHRN